MLLEAHKPEVAKLVENAKSILDNLSPVLEKELPKYLENNQENILDVLKHHIVTEKIASSGQDPEFIHKVAKASMPFLQDAMPSITKLANLTLSDSDTVADIMQKAALIKSLPKEEKKAEVQALLSTLIQIKNDNPEINKILEINNLDVSLYTHKIYTNNGNELIIFDEIGNKALTKANFEYTI